LVNYIFVIKLNMSISHNEAKFYKKNGYLVNFGDINSLVKAIQETTLSKGTDISKTINQSLSSEFISQEYLDALIKLREG